MKTYIAVLLFTISLPVCAEEQDFSIPVYAKGSDFYIEDPALTPLPAAVERAIRTQSSSQNTEMTSCNFVGKAVRLSEIETTPSDFIATTGNPTSENNCGWGATAATVWVVKKNKDAYTVVLSDDAAYWVGLIRKNKNHGLYDIKTSRGTAGECEIQFWAYTGRRYQKTRFYSFGADDDQKICNEHRDLCPYASETK